MDRRHGIYKELCGYKRGWPTRYSGEIQGQIREDRHGGQLEPVRFFIAGNDGDLGGFFRCGRNFPCSDPDGEIYREESKKKALKNLSA